MKSLLIIGGACLLVLIPTTIAGDGTDDESGLTTPEEVMKEDGQNIPNDDCGDASELGKCGDLLEDDDYDTFCNGNCVTVAEEYFECLGPQYDYLVEELEETCDAVSVSAMSTLIAIVIAVVTALN